MREQMANNNYRTAAEKVEKVAQNLGKHETAGELRKIAQLLLGESRTSQFNPMNFDPSNSFNVQQMSGPADPGLETQSNSSDPSGDGGLHPDIDSFVKVKEGPIENDLDQHTLSMTLEAPKDIKEHDMMNYMLGMEKSMGVRIVKFSWSLANKKQSSH